MGQAVGQEEVGRTETYDKRENDRRPLADDESRILGNESENAGEEKGEGNGKKDAFAAGPLRLCRSKDGSHGAFRSASAFYPLMTARGRSRATLRAMPTPCTTSTTWLTSL